MPTGKPFVTAYYIGFSMDMRAPAFMRQQTPKTRKGETRVAGRAHDQISENNLGGLVIKSEPASIITGRAIIPHYLMTVKETLLAAKRLVSGVPLEDVFNTPDALAHYNNAIETLIRDLENGKALNPPALITPHEPQGVRAADAEKHTIIAENIFNVFDLVCEWSLHDEDETPSAAMMTVALLATPGFDECGLPQSWFNFAEKYPKVAATVRAGAKAFAIPGNTTMEKECEKGLPIFYILNPIYQSGCRLNPPEEEEPGPDTRAGHCAALRARALDLRRKQSKLCRFSRNL
ncbi:hypothetical protein V8C43DRAFT_301071 [Trichoderma afarasin]